VEADNIAFLQYTLSPIIVSIENALNKDMLLEDEKEKGFFFQFDTSEILKTTEKEKFEAIKMSLDSGVITINEARQKINKKPVKDDVMKWSLGAVLYNPENGSMMIPNMGIGIPGYEGQSGSKLDPSIEAKDSKNEQDVTKEVDKKGDVDSGSDN
ncbi:phage portal protein, partial [Cetobacterium sp.]|uniref:phage portal protein n=1 Tax=Cetobacterium sp. TaxID=2071632 RepID=UPI003EE6D0B9